MRNTNNTRQNGKPVTGYSDSVIDLASRRRGLLERRGADPLEVAVHMCLETGAFVAWGSDYDDGGWAA